MNHWDTRYANPEFAYGREPNAFFKSQIGLLKPGTLLLPAEGEGRNGVYAAQLGWQVTAFDTSAEGRKKALQLASEKGVTLDYIHGDMNHPALAPGLFDAVALIYAHQPPENRVAFHQWAWSKVKPGGWLILEGFHLDNLPFRAQNPGVGGPENPDWLFTESILQTDIPGGNTTRCSRELVTLEEGLYHRGTACVLRFLAQKQTA